MLPFSLKKLAAAAFAGAALAAAPSAFAAKPVEAWYHAVDGSLDYGRMGYTDKDGNFISLVGQTILGGRAEVEFTPTQEADIASFRMAMVVPVTGAQSEYFLVDGTQLVPMGGGRYYADFTSNLFNGVVRDGRFSIETYTLGEDGNPYALHGRMGAKSGFHFIVTRP
jgi:hypothetical protein